MLACCQPTQDTNIKCWVSIYLSLNLYRYICCHVTRLFLIKNPCLVTCLVHKYISHVTHHRSHAFSDSLGISGKLQHQAGFTNLHNHMHQPLHHRNSLRYYTLQILRLGDYKQKLNQLKPNQIVNKIASN